MKNYQFSKENGGYQIARLKICQPVLLLLLKESTTVLI